jgi:hypothetical protein
MSEFVKFFVDQAEKKNEESDKIIKHFKIETMLLIIMFNIKLHHQKKCMI